MSKIEEQVIEIIRKRAEAGKEKYGVTMERDDLSLTQWLDHLQEELLDGAIYLEKLREYTCFWSTTGHNVVHNEHGLICPMPLSLWPTWANYAAIDDFGYLAFFESEPKYDQDGYGWKELTNVTQTHWQEVPFDNKEKAFWKRK